MNFTRVASYCFRVLAINPWAIVIREMIKFKFLYCLATKIPAERYRANLLGLRNKRPINDTRLQFIATCSPMNILKRPNRTFRDQSCIQIRKTILESLETIVQQENSFCPRLFVVAYRLGAREGATLRGRKKGIKLVYKTAIKTMIDEDSVESVSRRKGSVLSALARDGASRGREKSTVAR